MYKFWSETLLVLGLAVLIPASAHASGSLSKHTTSWNGLTRYYAVYVPATLAAQPALVAFLNPTSQNAGTNPPYGAMRAWETLSDKYGFVMVWPISSYNPANRLWYWECYKTDSTFAVDPEDSNFLRWLLTSLQSLYSISPTRTFVSGMSSGGFMAHRVGTDLSDIVAAIAPVSGMIDIHPIDENFDPPVPAYPVSVLELQGDDDTVVPYCGGSGWYWGKLHDDQPSSDDSVNFWILANSCTKKSSAQPLCTAGVPTAGVTEQDGTGCAGAAEVTFQREVGVAHAWVPGTEARIWSFFMTHPRAGASH